ncbi:MAG: LysR family transcriptional regulator [Variovorax sp.]|nr:MAG: LysR family transcriptional regulator [Variovorax sp.]
MSTKYDLVDVCLIVNVCDGASLTRGAERTHMSTPAASARLRKVQDALGTQLFTRTSQGLLPTANGDIFIRHARLILAQIGELERELQASRATPSGSVRLFANTLAIAEFVPAALERFLLSFPGMSIDLHERASADIAKALRSGAADVGILSADMPDEGFHSVPYRTEHLVLVTRREHPLAANGPVRFVQTLGSDYVGLDEHASLQAFITNAAASEGMPMKLRIQAKNFEALCALVESGVGVGVIPASVARRHALQLQIDVVPLLDAWSVRVLKIGFRGLSAATEPSRALVEVLSADAYQGADC